MLRAAIPIAAALLVGTPQAACAQQLTGTELNELLSGQTIDLSAPFGSLPIEYAADGTMVARSAVLAVFSGIYEDKGTWRIAGDQFCQGWKTWTPGKEQCFTVHRGSTTLHWKSNDGMTGTASARK